MKRIVPVIVGPTAVGKTRLSLLLAERLPVEVISADSRQIYKLMDIGTAKAPQHIRATVPHHFIDICTPDQTFSAGQFGEQARNTVQDIFGRNKLPVVAGGSGLYIRALLDGFFERQIKDEDIRRRLEDELAQKGLDNLYSQLQQVDPAYAQKISKNDPQRIMRALEVYRASGRPLSFWHQQKTNAAPFPFFQIGLTMERSALYRRINQRVDEMLHQGLVEEVKTLLQKGYSPQLNALNTVGYKEVVAYLKGALSFEEMVGEIKKNSRRYAKRQLTWFKKDQRIEWYEINDAGDLPAICDTILCSVQI